MTPLPPLSPLSRVSPGASVRVLCGALKRFDAQIPVFCAPPKTALILGFLLVLARVGVGGGVRSVWQCQMEVCPLRARLTHPADGSEIGKSDSQLFFFCASRRAQGHARMRDPGAFAERVRASCRIRTPAENRRGRTHADAPQTGLSRRGRRCGIRGSRRTNAAV